MYSVLIRRSCLRIELPLTMENSLFATSTMRSTEYRLSHILLDYSYLSSQVVAICFLASFDASVNVN
jgi:hypothetical protein